jgi:hypothetical protein
MSKYGITAVLKEETSIIASISASLIGRVVMLLIMYVAIFKTGIIVFICIKRHIMIMLHHTDRYFPLLYFM